MEDPNDKNPTNQTNQNTQPQASEKSQENNDLKEDSIRPLRTYEDDVRNAVYNQKISTANILKSEDTKKQRLAEERSQTDLNHPKNRRLLQFGAVLVVVGIIALIYIQFVNPILFKDGPSAKAVLEQSVIYLQDQNEINTKDRARLDILNDLRNSINKEIANGSMEEIALVTTRDDANETTVRIDTQNLFGLLGVPVLNRAIRSMGDNFVLGIHGREVSEPFLVIEIDDFSNVFAGMIEWESVLVQDIKPIFFRNLEEKIVEIEGDVATSTDGVSSEENSENDEANPEGEETLNENEEDSPETSVVPPPLETALDYNPTKFEDFVLNNRDIRAIKNFGGEIIFFYSLIDENHLVMTTNKETFAEIIRMIQSSALVQ